MGEKVAAIHTFYLFMYDNGEFDFGFTRSTHLSDKSFEFRKNYRKNHYAHNQRIGLYSLVSMTEKGSSGGWVRVVSLRAAQRSEFAQRKRTRSAAMTKKHINPNAEKSSECSGNSVVECIDGAWVFFCS